MPRQPPALDGVLAATADGRFVIAWHDIADNHYKARVFKADGSVSSTADTTILGTNLSSFTNTIENRIELAGLTDNDFAAVFTADSNAGADVIVTHGGNDTIRFNTALGASNIDQITDFDVAKDIIQLENAIFIELTTNTGNALSGGEFFIGSAAHDADDRIIYNSATGALIYDSNGNGANGATQFATLATGLGLTSGDFFVV